MAESTNFETLQLHAGHTVDESGSRGVPIYATTRSVLLSLASEPDRPSYVFQNSEHGANLFALKEFVRSPSTLAASSPSRATSTVA